MSTGTPQTAARGLRQVVARVLVPAAAAEAATAALEMERGSKDLATARLRVRTGNLRRSITTTSEIRGDSVVLTHRAGGGVRDVVYAAIQEYGGTVTPRHGKYLAIPVGRALTPAGVPRYHSPRQVHGLQFRRSGGGNLVAGLPVGKGGKRFDVLFWLVKSVTIRGKRYLRDPFERVAADMPQRIADAMVTRLVQVMS